MKVFKKYWTSNQKKLVIDGKPEGRDVEGVNKIINNLTILQGK
jgi:hypothetical protein